MKNKIIAFKDISKVVGQFKEEGKKVVHCHGVFDLIHPGHIKHFEAAKKFGDILVVSITEDINVNKGPGRPIFDENLRCENIAAFAFVDFVTINRHPTAITAIEAIKPNFYVKGQDYKNAQDDFSGGIIEEKNAVEKFGGHLVFTDEIQFSSSRLINRHLDNTDEELNNYLEKVRKSIPFSKLKSDFENISKYRVLVVGDVILDEYQFVRALGKASKFPIITTKRLDRELYAGGALAVANHIANFVSEVKLISTYGLNSGINYLDFIKENLNSKVEFAGIYTPNRPTVLKKRFIDKVFKHKLFEIIDIDDSPFSAEIIEKLHEQLKGVEDNYDLIVVADFGHGLLNMELINSIISKNVFLSVNTQTNSANSGYNFLTKYKKCDYFSIDNEEARLATHEKHLDIEYILQELMSKTNAKLGAITKGVEGAVLCESKSAYVTSSPILSHDVVDTIGAGDAFLSITSLLARNGNSTEEIAFVGNAVGAMAVKILGNKSYIEKVPLLKYLKTLLT